MGFPVEDVLTPEALVEEFQCKICHQLVEYAQCSHTPCAHVFCRGCLDDWLARSNDSGRTARGDGGDEPSVGTRCPT